MKISGKLNCIGLSMAPTILRIKQAMVDKAERKAPLEILVSTECDLDRLKASLGKLSKDVRVFAEPA